MPFKTGRRVFVLRDCRKLSITLPELEYEFDIEENYPRTFAQLTPGQRRPVAWTCVKCGHHWSSTVSNRLRGSECPRCRGKIPIPGETDLATVFPETARQWDYSRNPNGPEDYLPYSNQIVGWICESGHRWREKINNRTANGLGCPFCTGTRPIPGINDLGTLYPWLTAQWHQDENGNLKPSDVFPQSNRRVSWICERGHKWEAKIYHRTAGQGCPYCAGLKPIPNETDLETLAPEISKQWISEKNQGRKPSEFTYSSHFRAIWKCSQGHEYPMPIYKRTRGSGCPVCIGKVIVPGENDLASQAPQLALEWDVVGNGDIKPNQVALHSNTKYSWICSECGHAWKATPNNRTAGKGCPRCAGCCVDPEINSFAVRNPTLIAQWDTDRNEPRTAWDVAAFDNRNYYWICSNGHSFIASPANRTKGTGCPYCNGKLPIVGVNDCKSICPDAASEWHPTANEQKDPEQYLPNSHEEVYWLCKKGHTYQRKIYEKTRGSGCPYCAERIPVAGKTDLATLHGALIPRWDLDRNKKPPEQFFPDSAVRVWWKCEEGHRFCAPIREMTLRWHCLQCEKQNTHRRK